MSNYISSLIKFASSGEILPEEISGASLKSQKQPQIDEISRHDQKYLQQVKANGGDFSKIFKRMQDRFARKEKSNNEMRA
jgi:hypothetical protein